MKKLNVKVVKRLYVYGLIEVEAKSAYEAEQKVINDIADGKLSSSHIKWSSNIEEECGLEVMEGETKTIVSHKGQKVIGVKR